VPKWCLRYAGIGSFVPLPHTGHVLDALVMWGKIALLKKPGKGPGIARSLAPFPLPLSKEYVRETFDIGRRYGPVNYPFNGEEAGDGIG
jgi:hypothetical protein